MLIASQISVGHENELGIRVFGDRGSLRWRQEEPNTMLYSPLGEPTPHPEPRQRVPRRRRAEGVAARRPATPRATWRRSRTSTSASSRRSAPAGRAASSGRWRATSRGSRTAPAACASSRRWWRRAGATRSGTSCRRELSLTLAIAGERARIPSHRLVVSHRYSGTRRQARLVSRLATPERGPGLAVGGCQACRRSRVRRCRRDSTEATAGESGDARLPTVRQRHASRRMRWPPSIRTAWPRRSA